MNNNIIVAILVGITLFSGCTSETVSSPESALKAQMDGLKYYQGNDLYELLSSDLKLKYTADNLQNKMFALKQGSIAIEDYKVIDKIENGNTATFKVEVVWTYSGIHKTKTHTVSFVLENGNWKISDNPTLR